MYVMSLCKFTKLRSLCTTKEINQVAQTVLLMSSISWSRKCLDFNFEEQMKESNQRMGTTKASKDAAVNLTVPHLI